MGLGSCALVALAVTSFVLRVLSFLFKKNNFAKEKTSKGLEALETLEIWKWYKLSI